MLIPTRHGSRLVVAAALALSVGACGPRAGQSPEPTGGETAAAPVATEAPAGGAMNVPLDTFVWVTIGEPESLDPAWTYETSGSGIQANIYDPLTYFDREKPDAFVPALATDWTVSEDQLTYTFNIRKGVTFHEGGTLEPHDIAYSFHRAMLQDRIDGPMVLFLDPMLGTSSIESLALETAGISTDVAEGQEAPTLDDVPADVAAQVCEMVKATAVADDEAGTVTVKVQNPTAWFLQLTSQPWIAGLDMEWMVEQGDWDGDCATWREFHNPAAEESTLFTAANGTGPYKLGEWKKGQEITLEANEGYWRTEPVWEGGPSGPPALKHIVIQKVDEWGTRFAKLQAGEADIVSVPRAEIGQLEDMIRFEYAGGDETAPMTEKNPAGTLKLFVGYPSVAATAAMFNFNVTTEGGNEFIGSGALDGEGIPPDFFAAIHARKGFRYCFDWDTFISQALLGEGVKTRGPIIAGLQGYSETNEIYDHDLAKCGEELALAWDGKVAETGFKMTIAYNAGNVERQTAAEILADSLAQVDEKYQIEVVSLEWPSFLEARRARKFPISVSGWQEDYHDASNWVHPFLHSAGAYGRAQSFPADLATQFDTLIDGAVFETDQTKREAMYTQQQQMAIDNAVDIFLYQATGRTYLNAQVNGFFNNPLGPGLWFYQLSKEG